MRSADEIADLAARTSDAYAKTGPAHPERMRTLGAWGDALAWMQGAAETPFGDDEPEDDDFPVGNLCEPFESLADDLGLIAPEPVEFCHIAVERGASGGKIYAVSRSWFGDAEDNAEAAITAAREALGTVQIDGADIGLELEALPATPGLAEALRGDWSKVEWFRWFNSDGSSEAFAEEVPF